MSILVIGDNADLMQLAERLAKERPNGKRYVFGRSTQGNIKYPQIDVSRVRDAELILSLHCHDVFPPAIVCSMRCVNLHPGVNPHNRGWHPATWSLKNGLPAGATLHEMDEKIDHGPIIAQRMVVLRSDDTISTLLPRVYRAERELLVECWDDVILGTYRTWQPGEGNLNLKRDLEAA